MKNKAIKNFLIIKYIGDNDKLGLKINKDFFIYNFKNNKNGKGQFLTEILNFLDIHNVKLNESFSIIVNQGPGSFSGLRISLAVAKGMKISKKVKLFGYKNSDLKSFNIENIERLIDENLIEKKLIQPIYISKLN